MNAPCGYLSFHADGTIIKINRTLCDWLQYEESDILYKKTFCDLLVKGGVIYYEMFYIPLLKMQGFVNEINFDIRRADGTQFPSLVNSMAIQDKNEKIRAVNVTIFNITDRKKYESELLNAKREADTEKKRFELLANNTPDIIFTATPDGTIEYGNKRFFDYFNIPTKSINQRFVFRKIHPADKRRAMRLWMQAVAESKQFETELRIQNAGGEYIWHLVRSVPYTDDSTSILKFFGTCINIEAQKALQTKKDEFITLASHELKTPLASLKGYIQIIQKERKDPLFTNIVKRCIKAVNNMQYLVSSLLDVSRIHSGQLTLTMEASLLYDMLTECIDLTTMNYPSHRIKFIFLAEKETSVWMDSQRIQQVIINLLTNAIKYSPGSTEVLLCAEKMEGEPRIKLTVQDYGIGIPQDEKTQIFDKYYRVKRSTNNNQVSGLGIGLFIIKEIISLHNSEMHVESEMTKGSQFYFSLPIAQTPLLTAQ